MSELGFGTETIVVNDAGMEIALSGDRQAFTVTFLGLEVIAEEGRTPIATRVVSFVVPVEGATKDAQITLKLDGFASVNDGATGLLTLTANGEALTKYLAPGMDGQMAHELRIEAADTPACRVSLCLVGERDSDMPDAIARFSVLTLDGELTRLNR